VPQWPRALTAANAMGQPAPTQSHTHFNSMSRRCLRTSVPTQALAFTSPPNRPSCGKPHRTSLSTEPREDPDGRIVDMETSEKQRAIEALRSLPEHATIEDAIERLCFIAKIEEGLRQSDAGQLVSHDEVKKQLLS
jgi:predicted transcriptional regulator